MTDNPFDSTIPAPAPAPVDVAQIRQTLIGDDAKYKTEDDAIKGLFHAQAHITKLEHEAAERERQLQAAAAEKRAVDDILAAIDSKKQATTPAPTQAPREIPTHLEGTNQQPAVETPSKPAALDEEVLTELIRKQMQADQSVRAKEANVNKAIAVLDGKYGSREATKYEIQKKAEILGVSADFLQSIAEQSSEGFLELMGASTSSAASKPASTKMPSSVSSESFLKHAPASAGKPEMGTYRWYQELRKTDPRAYRKMYPQQMRDMQDDREKFYGTSS